MGSCLRLRARETATAAAADAAWLDLAWLDPAELADIGKLAFDRSPIQSTGLAGLAACLLIILTSLRPVRRAAYRLFLASHIIGWISLLVAT